MKKIFISIIVSHMKKFLGILVLGLFFISSPAKSDDYGRGELILDDYIVDYFIAYLKGKQQESPGDFVVATDSSYATSSYCPYGSGNCADGSMVRRLIQYCESKATSECFQFAKGRTVKWKNGINTGRKASKFNSKWSDSEVRAKLTELGFLD